MPTTLALRTATDSKIYPRCRMLIGWLAPPVGSASCATLRSKGIVQLGGAGNRNLTMADLTANGLVRMHCVQRRNLRQGQGYSSKPCKSPSPS